ncbi:hypothetical protein Ac42p215 [Acinetobacter phage Ac42]|uniref:hypothetical protein n=1 Tax=Acinetobacter phage Ac42 TaxID=762660 RepID=UPI0001EBCDFF|nr:hypothetical protein Ac42p215 [Acinetobacter phage Ac42]ADI96451.1 hypothetical protein Ac42p215 [Acinetobacter phage Ac42]
MKKFYIEYTYFRGIGCNAFKVAEPVEAESKLKAIRVILQKHNGDAHINSIVEVKDELSKFA